MYIYAVDYPQYRYDGSCFEIWVPFFYSGDFAIYEIGIIGYFNGITVLLIQLDEIVSKLVVKYLNVSVSGLETIFHYKIPMNSGSISGFDSSSMSSHSICLYCETVIPFKTNRTSHFLFLA